MLKKRLVGVVTVKAGWAVQSFGYSRHLPLGRPEILVENLDRWGVDEILLQCIDRSRASAGPDFELLHKVSRIGITTPLIYSGGIHTREDAVKAVNLGADRIMVDAMLLDTPPELEAAALELGTQAVIAHLPLRSVTEGFQVLDYRSKKERPLNEMLPRLPLSWASEVMLTDWSHEGHPNGFDMKLLEASDAINKPLICFGGISSAQQLFTLLGNPRVVAAGVGNFLSYREHAVQALKADLTAAAIRPPFYESRTT